MSEINELEITPIEAAIIAAGGVVKLADLLSVNQSTVSMWKHRGQVAADRARDVEKVVNGVVTVYDLRPDVFGEPPNEAA